MMRVLLVVTVAALPACTYELDGPEQHPPPDILADAAVAPDARDVDAGEIDAGIDASSLHTCNDPIPSDGCDAHDCDLNQCGGNVLYACDTTSGQWHQEGYCEWFPPTVDGTWSLYFTLVGNDPCPELMHPDGSSLQLHNGGSSNLQVASGDGTPLTTTTISSTGHAGFHVPDTWNTPSGPLPVQLEYGLTFTSTTVVGSATAHVQEPGQLCEYAFSVMGNKL